MSTAVAPTVDLEQATADLREHGYCLVEDVLSPQRSATILADLKRLARKEVEEGTDYVYDGGSNQRIWNLLNKGELYEELVQDPTVCGFIEELLGNIFLLSNCNANIAGPGGQPMFLHCDQSFVPPPYPAYPLVANVMWMITEFTPENGATRVVPGSHLLGHGPTMGEPPEMVPVCGSAGTIMIFDGRLWHQTGPNTSKDDLRYGILTYYCRPFMRQQENYFVSLRQEVLNRATPFLRQLLGWENYFSVGMIDGMPRDQARY